MAVPNSYWFSKNDAEQSVTNYPDMVEYHTLDFTAPAEGDYLILVSCAWNRTVNYGYIDFILDDSVQLANHEVCLGSNTSKALDYRTFHTMYLAEGLASGSHHIDIDARMSAINSQGYIRYCKIAVIRLDDFLSTSGMYDYNAVEAQLALSTTADSFSTCATITFTPDEAGDYLILGSIELDCNNAGDSIATRINYDSGSEYIPVNNSEESGSNYCTGELPSTGCYWGWVFGGIVNIPASSKTILLEACRTGGTTQAYVRKRRLLVIRLSAITDCDYDEVTTNTSTTSQWTDKGTLTFTPSATIDYLILGMIVNKPDSITYPAHTRIEQTAGTGTGTICLDNVDSKDSSNPADCFPMFTVEVKELAAISQTFKSQYGYANSSGTTYSKGSVIVAIPLEEGGAPPEEYYCGKGIDRGINRGIM